MVLSVPFVISVYPSFAYVTIDFIHTFPPHPLPPPPPPDLMGLMQMQRRLSGMERDLAAINAKLDSLNEDSQKLAEDRPEEAEEIRREVDEIKVVWEDLKRVLKARDEALGEASELQNFLRDLDHFQGWLTKTQVSYLPGCSNGLCFDTVC